MANAFANAADGAKACIRCDSAAEFMITALDAIVTAATAEAEAAMQAASTRGESASAAAVEFGLVFLLRSRDRVTQVTSPLPSSGGAVL